MSDNRVEYGIYYQYTDDDGTVRDVTVVAPALSEARDVIDSLTSDGLPAHLVVRTVTYSSWKKVDYGK